MATPAIKKTKCSSAQNARGVPLAQYCAVSHAALLMMVSARVRARFRALPPAARCARCARVCPHAREKNACAHDDAAYAPCARAQRGLARGVARAFDMRARARSRVKIAQRYAPRRVGTRVYKICAQRRARRRAYARANILQAPAQRARMIRRVAVPARAPQRYAKSARTRSVLLRENDFRARIIRYDFKTICAHDARAPRTRGKRARTPPARLYQRHYAPRDGGRAPRRGVRSSAVDVIATRNGAHIT